WRQREDAKSPVRINGGGGHCRLAASVFVTAAGIAVWRPPFLLPWPALSFGGRRFCYRGRHCRLAASVFTTPIRKHKNTAAPGISGAAVFGGPIFRRPPDPPVGQAGCFRPGGRPQPRGSRG